VVPQVDFDMSALSIMTGTVADREIEFSCSLCGDIFELACSKFKNTVKDSRDVICLDCTRKIEKREYQKCRLCFTDYDYSPYWYIMKGMEPPKTCKTCKKNALKEEK
jgi:hypothetical protein